MSSDAPTPPPAASPAVPAANGRDARRAEQAASIHQLVGFRLEGQDYAIAITRIQEIILMKPITRIPQVPPDIEGLINLRGVVIPLINLRTRFGLPSRPFDDDTRTIVVNLRDKTIGCIVDSVTQVMRIGRDQIQPPPLNSSSAARSSIAGLAKLDERLLIILDVDRLFGPEASEIDAAIASAT